MADPKKRLPTNVQGDFFVDSTCINCDACRQLAPETFAEKDGHSCVFQQPADTTELRHATQALLACPTGSIGTAGVNIASEVMNDFPLLVDDNIYYCGFTSPKSYGANSYFIKHPDGNWLVDSPKFLPHLISAFHEHGGIKYIFLTHCDDVAESHLYAKEFAASRIIHETDSSTHNVEEVLIEGSDDYAFAADFTIIPTPGHTRGHCALLYRNCYLFTGDHLAYDREEKALEASPDVCWYDWELQVQSLERLTKHRFEWILPGHGQRVHLSPDDMLSALQDLLAKFQ